jgi:proteic killer suppression protein
MNSREMPASGSDVGTTLTNRILHSVSLCDTLNSVIKSFAHKGIEKFFRTGSKAGIQAKHAQKLSLQLALLNAAKQPEDLSAPGWRLHPLRGELSGHWAIMVSGNWRLTFKFEAQDAILVDYQDYH